MQSRNEEILTAIADGTSSSELKPAQSREEALLLRILDRVNDLGELGGKFKVHICTSSEYDHLTGIPTILGPEENTFYLVPSGSGTDVYKEWVYTNGNWELFGGGGGGSIDIPVTDVQVNGVSVLDAQGVAEIPVAGKTAAGVIKVNNSNIEEAAANGGTLLINGELYVGGATNINAYKFGYNQVDLVCTPQQHLAVFYGLSKAAGVSMASSSNPVGTYTDAAKEAIRNMIGAGDSNGTEIVRLI